MEYLLFFMLGTCCASFLVVVAQRVPQHMSLLKPASHCFNCHTPLRYRDLIPIVSYLRLKGRCFSCHQSFSPLSFLCEIGLGILFVCLTCLGVWERSSIGPLILLLSAFVLSLTDILYLTIEPRIFYPAMVAVGLSLFDLHSPLRWHIIESLIIFFSLSLLNLGKSRLGLGDITLLSFWGLFLGLQGVAKVILVGSLTALLFCFFYYNWQKKIVQIKLPFVPFLSVGLLSHLLVSFWL